MPPTYEQYHSGCHMISLLTNLDVHLFDIEGVAQLHYACYELPAVLERYKQEDLVCILEQSLLKEHVYVFRNSIQLEFLAAGVWDGAEQRGTLVVGPFIRKAYHPQVLQKLIAQQRLPLAMQQQLYQCYNTLMLVDEAKQQAIVHLLLNVLTPETRQPQLVETALPPSENIAVNFNADQEQDRALVERRYETENKLLHAIARGDSQLLKQVMEEFKGLPWSYRYPNASVRSMKNLSFSHNTLFKKAAESAGVHSLYLDSLSGKFAIQIEQAQSLVQLTSLYEEMPHAYCSAVRELAVAALPPLLKEAVTYIRFHLDQPLRLSRIAATLGVHPSYLSRVFKKELGMTLTDYINKLRIEEAKYLLAHANISVTEAALSVGYTDSNYFSKVFHKLEQTTPQDYRKRKKGDALSL